MGADEVIQKARESGLLGGNIGVGARKLVNNKDRAVHSVLFKLLPKGGSVTACVTTGSVHVAGKADNREKLLALIKPLTKAWNDGTPPAGYRGTRRSNSEGWIY